jgi:hypothetical protein
VFPCESKGFVDPSEQCDEYRADLADKLWDDGVKFSVFWLIIFVGTMIGNTVMFYGFGVASERLSKRLRNLMFDTLLRQEPGFYDVNLPPLTLNLNL